MQGLNDCYVLSPRRSAQIALSFLEEFLPNREPSFVVEDLCEVLGIALDESLENIVEHLATKPGLDCSMYFRNLEGQEPQHVAVMFLEDGNLILMLSVNARGGPEIADRYLQALQGFVGGATGYWGWEESPVSDAQAFRERVLVHEEGKGH